MVLGHNKARARDNARGTIKLLKLSRLAVLLIFFCHRSTDSDTLFTIANMLCSPFWKNFPRRLFFCVFVAKESEKAARRKCRKSSGPPVRPRIAI
jgi:hypothetical protein